MPKSLLLLFVVLFTWAACSPKKAQKNANADIAIVPPPPVAPTLPTNKDPKAESTPVPPIIIPKPAPTPTSTPSPKKSESPPKRDLTFMTGADQIDRYLPLLQGQRVALVVNQTSTANGMHLVDALLSVGVDIHRVFAPEHGFRGDADAGEYVANARDKITGLPIASLYGKNKKPSTTDLADIDIVVFDIQDVGARFYTYISTLHYIMEACAENQKQCIVLDRPNPNGHYIDGPVLDPENRSFVGMHTIPLVHGLTVGELAQMINGERWLANKQQCQLNVIPCIGYTHTFFYQIPVKPSPNLPNNRAIYLYPSLCLFEGTVISVGRGTDKQFQVIGAPGFDKMPYTFKPIPKPGAKTPPHQNQTCRGLDLSNLSERELQQTRQIQLKWLLDFYKASPDKAHFFLENNFFNQLAGNKTLKQQIIAGKSEDEIRKTWQPALKTYKNMRKKYLLYTDFE